MELSDVFNNNPSTDPDKKFLYRYDDYVYSNINEFGDLDGPGRIEVRCSYYEILKETPKGVWIKYYLNPLGKKFVLLSARKQFACRTKEKALLMFRFRKIKQVKILEAKLSYAKRALAVTDPDKSTLSTTFDKLMD